MRMLGNRSKRRSTMIEPRKSWMTRSNSMCSAARLMPEPVAVGAGLEAVRRRVAGDREAGVAGVGDHGDARLVHPGPEGVERRVRGREQVVRRPDRGGPHDDGAGVVVEGPLELPHGPVDVAEAEGGAGEDAVLVGEAPVLEQPPVEGGEEEGDGLGVVLEVLLVEDPEGGEQPHLVDALVVHGAEAGVVVAVLGADRLGAAEVLHRRLARRCCRGSTRPWRPAGETGSKVGLVTSWFTAPAITW